MASTRTKAGAIPAAVADYYEAAPSPQRETLLELRRRILALAPGAAEIMKYRMPTFVVDGRALCGLLANANHVGFYPYSGSVVDRLPALAAKYGGTKGSLHLPIDRAIPAAELKEILRAKAEDEAGRGGAKKPVAKKPVAKKPATKKPAAKKPVAKKPVATTSKRSTR